MGYPTETPASIPDAARLALRQTVSPTGVALSPPNGSVQGSYADTVKTILGPENMAAWWAALMGGSASSVLISGDSTFANYGITDPNTYWTVLLSDACKRYGFAVTVSANAISGKASSDWLSTYLPQDLAGSQPTLYVIKWGMNDPNNSYNLTVEQTIANLRAGLSLLRVVWSRDATSVIVMMPNTARYASQPGVNELWRERVAAGLAQAAIDYDCVFFDTYAFARSIRPMSTWLDGMVVHPLENFQRMISGGLSEIMFPEHVRNWVSKITNVTPGARFTQPGAGSGRLSTRRLDALVCLSGYLNGPSATLSLGDVIGTIANPFHTPSLDEWGCYVTAYSGSGIEILPVVIQHSNAQIILKKASTVSPSLVMFNATWAIGRVA